MRLFKVFSDNALFQADSLLTIRGVAEKNTKVTVSLTGNSGVFSDGACISDKDGLFECTLKTPAASYDKYEISATDGVENVKVANVIFGELWLAAGQSNMELDNSQLFECDWYLEKLKDIDIRAYCEDYGDNVFSLTPENETGGRWVSSLNHADLKYVSACATAFSEALSRHFESEGVGIPVGFLNLSWGGTPIRAWIPMENLMSDEVVVKYLERHSLLKVDEKDINYQYLSVMFNRRIAPVRGVKVRGMIWYQGESDSDIEHTERIYKHLFYMLTGIYKELFALDKDNFKVISSLIYPWQYTNIGDTQVGVLNDALVKASVEHPETYVCFSVYDLPPRWNALNNHPIHPTHKNALGRRMAELTLRNVYGLSGQKMPSFMRSYRIENNRIILTFDKHEKGLYTSDGLHVRGMYIAGKDRLYMPADCEILSDCEMAVYHPCLDEPCHCLYGWSSVEVNLNLFSGEYPVLPFATDADSKEPIVVELKPFLNLEVPSKLECFFDETPDPDWYYRPVWQPLNGCDVCLDNAFTMITEGYKYSVGVGSRNNPFGMYTTTEAGHAFDFKNYSSLLVDVFHRGDISFDAIVEYDDGKGVKLCGAFMAEVAPKFNRYSFDFSKLPEGKIVKLSLVFSIDNVKTMKHVNVGRMYLCPKK